MGSHAKHSRRDDEPKRNCVVSGLFAAKVFAEKEDD